MPQPEGRLPQVVKKKEGHMPELRKRRSHLALLGVFAMVASVLAVGAPSVIAEAGKPEAAARYSACVGPAAVDAGFTDVATGSTHDAAINCIAYYGITKGTTATTFAPNQTISRWQLAVMLQRAAGPAGVTLPEAADRGYTDISEMSSSFQDAINQMGALSIMAGTTATTFDPSGIVSRAVIVEALAGLLINARVGPGGRALSRDVDLSLSVKSDASAGATDITVDETFRDLGGVTYATHQAVRHLAEMGVVQGRGDGTFGPAASVTRAQAAAFITRALAHTNARPAGLTMQAATEARGASTTFTTTDDFDLSISIRGEDFAPVESASVDVFMHPTRNAATAFKNDGTCNTGTGGSEAVGGGTGICTIELDDEVTEPDGNVTITPGRLTGPAVYWAWSADAGAKLDWDVTENVSMDNSVVSNAASLSLSTETAPASAKVSSSVSSDAEMGKTVRYGTTVTVTIQLVDASDKNLAAAGHSYSWWATGEHDPQTSVLAGTGTRVIQTDSTGKATFTLTASDPDTNRDGTNDNNKTTWTYRIARVPTDPSTPNVAANTDIGFTVTSGTGEGSIIFDDDPGRATKVIATVQRAWTPQPQSGGVARVGVTGKVTDQYGNPLRGYPIYFDLSGGDEFGCDDDASDGCTANTGIGDDAYEESDEIEGTVRRITRSNGTNSISATWAQAGGTETVKYHVAADFTGGADDDPNDSVGDTDEIASVRHWWVLPPSGLDAESGSAGRTTPSGNVAGLGHVPLEVVDFERKALIMRSVWPQPPGDNHYRVYNWTDSTKFKWFVGANPPVATDESAPAVDSNSVPLIRWLDAAEFEVRMRKHLATIHPVDAGEGRLEMRMGVEQYNTKSGESILSIKLDGSTVVAENEAAIQDPPAG